MNAADRKNALILTILILRSGILAQEKVEVYRIIDCNRFQLKDDLLIQLANVETSSLSDTSRDSKRVTKMIMEYFLKEVNGLYTAGRLLKKNSV